MGFLSNVYRFDAENHLTTAGKQRLHTAIISNQGRLYLVLMFGGKNQVLLNNPYVY